MLIHAARKRNMWRSSDSHESTRDMMMTANREFGKHCYGFQQIQRQTVCGGNAFKDTSKFHIRQRTLTLRANTRRKVRKPTNLQMSLSSGTGTLAV